MPGALKNLAALQSSSALRCSISQRSMSFPAAPIWREASFFRSCRFSRFLRVRDRSGKPAAQRGLGAKSPTRPQVGARPPACLPRLRVMVGARFFQHDTGSTSLSVRSPSHQPEGALHALGEAIKTGVLDKSVIQKFVCRLGYLKGLNHFPDGVFIQQSALYVLFEDHGSQCLIGETLNGLTALNCSQSGSREIVL